MNTFIVLANEITNAETGSITIFIRLPITFSDEFFLAFSEIYFDRARLLYPKHAW